MCQALIDCCAPVAARLVGLHIAAAERRATLKGLDRAFGLYPLIVYANRMAPIAQRAARGGDRNEHLRSHPEIRANRPGRSNRAAHRATQSDRAAEISRQRTVAIWPH